MTSKVTPVPYRRAGAIVLIAIVLPALAAAQARDPKLISCAELMALPAAEQAELTRAMVEASADALDLDDLVTETGEIGTILEICVANPEMRAFDAAMHAGK